MSEIYLAEVARGGNSTSKSAATRKPRWRNGSPPMSELATQIDLYLSEVGRRFDLLPQLDGLTRIAVRRDKHAPRAAQEWMAANV